jgi:transcription termination/antitermination protein NusA
MGRPLSGWVLISLSWAGLASAADPTSVKAPAEQVKKLLQQEVPEIAAGIVRIEAVAREPGVRSKVALSSNDPDVDPIGACVGLKGRRIQAVVQALNGEPIDLIPWDTKPERFVAAALAPANVARIVIDEPNRRMELIVPDDQLSIAVGRRGVNLRLAAELTGWALDLRSESKEKELRELAHRSLGALPKVSKKLVDTLYRYGFRDAKDVAEASPEMLREVPGIDPAQIPALQAHAKRQAVEEAKAAKRPAP